MDPKSDLLQVVLHWLGTRGLLGVFLATATTLLRAILGFDSTPRELAVSFAAALFVIGFVAPGLAELLVVGPEGGSMIGAILGLTSRPLIEALMQLARSLRQDALSVLKAWISRRWD